MPVLSPAPRKAAARKRKTRTGVQSLSLRMAAAAGLTSGAKTKHLNAKVSPELFDAAAKRAGSQSPAAVIEAALAALATQDDLGPWLATEWGSLSGIDPELLAQIDF